MSVKALMRCGLWTEIREALCKDFPDMVVPFSAPPALEAVVKANADYITELSEATQ